MKRPEFKVGHLYQTTKKVAYASWDENEPDSYFGEAGSFFICTKWHLVAETDTDFIALASFYSLTTNTVVGLFINPTHRAENFVEVSLDDV